MSNDESTTEANRCRHYQRIDRMFAAVTVLGQNVSGDTGNPNSGRDYTRNASPEQQVDRLIRASPPVQLDEDR